jgi:hypothetical protein
MKRRIQALALRPGTGTFLALAVGACVCRSCGNPRPSRLKEPARRNSRRCMGAAAKKSGHAETRMRAPGKRNAFLIPKLANAGTLNTPLTLPFRLAPVCRESRTQSPGQAFSVAPSLPPRPFAGAGQTSGEQGVRTRGITCLTGPATAALSLPRCPCTTPRPWCTRAGSWKTS